MIVQIDTVNHPLVQYLSEDPVRPQISIADRVGHSSRFALALVTDRAEPDSIVCVRLCNSVPSSVSQLLDSSEGPNAIFYTIWSRRSGSGSQLIVQARQWLLDRYHHVDSYYTLSPIGESVRKFHMGLGAHVYRQNSDTVNYSYNSSR